MQDPINVAMIGLGFGAEFIPIYQAHSHGNPAAICRRNRTELDACGDMFGIDKRYTDFDELLADPDIDAAH
ncbi:MAG: putative dehydrogenase, partial [Rhodothermales bacterium]